MNDARSRKPDHGSFVSLGAGDPAAESGRALLEWGRYDAPPDGLEERVLEGLSARRRLEPEQQRRSQRAARWVGAAWGFGLAAIVAGITVIVWRALGPGMATGVPHLSAEPAIGTPLPSSMPPPPDACRAKRAAEGSAPLIDDFEDGDDVPLPLEGRGGFWRWTRDTDAPGTAPALLPSPHPEPRPKNRQALHVKGGKLGDWGAAIELTWKPGCYDAGAYAGIAFSARGPGRIYVAPRQVSVLPAEFGGSCERDCFNAHVRKLDLDGSFRTYQVRWTEVEQRGYGRPAIDASELHSLMFQIRPEDTPYDIWIDDVRFLVSGP